MCGKPECFQQLIHRERAFREISPDLDILPHCQIRDQIVHLKYIAQMLPPILGEALLGKGAHPLTTHRDLTGVRAVDSANDI